jgi:hypothetical protein
MYEELEISHVRQRDYTGVRRTAKSWFTVNQCETSVLKPWIHFEESHHPKVMLIGFFALSLWETDFSLINYFPNWASHSLTLAMV